MFILDKSLLAPIFSLSSISESAEELRLLLVGNLAPSVIDEVDNGMVDIREVFSFNYLKSFS